jgi:ribosomal protein L29
MKYKELANMGSNELKSKLEELELELIKLNTQVATGTPPKNAGSVRRIKKDIARIMLLKSTTEKEKSASVDNKSKMGKSQKANKKSE